MPAQAAHDIQFINTVEYGVVSTIGHGPAGYFYILIERMRSITLVLAPRFLGDSYNAGQLVVHSSWLFIGVPDYFPVQRGGRFSANALGPSFASSLLNTRPLSSDSIL